MYKEPTSAQLKLVYQNPETQTHLTQLALQVCMSLGIDYRDLLPRNLDNRADANQVNMSEAQIEVKNRQMEIRRKRRINQVANKIIMERLQYSNGRNKSAKLLRSKIQ